MNKKKKQPKITVFTIGHSTRSLDDFISLLKEHNIKQVIDIRTIAKSRHNPQFNQASLRQALKNHRINYRHMKGLGGLRHAHKDSINTAWHNLSFRGYADYMQTPAFTNNIEKLVAYAHKKQIVIMCAEAVPWRCHRSLIGDALLVRSINVEDIMSKTNTKKHTLTPWAKVRGTHITYPASKL
jgi:uncharacterized protein (DUF488 family)